MNKNKKLIMAQKGLSSSVVELNTEQVDCLIKIVEDVIKREEDKYYLLLDDNEKELDIVKNLYNRLLGLNKVYSDGKRNKK